MHALCYDKFNIQNLSPSDDTQTLKRILNSEDLIADVGAAGTTMRFLTSYYAIKKGEKILTGSERMKQRPIEILVNALKSLGADIHYLELAGYPPIQIKGKALKGGHLKIKADISSQYISSLLMIAPVLKEGLKLELVVKISSRPYFIMTLKLMEQLGIKHEFTESIIEIYPSEYIAKPMKVESDWSAASYYFSIAALSDHTQLKIKGLFAESLQGDSVLPEIYSHLGVVAGFKQNVLILENTSMHAKFFEYDFSNCPDLAQTVVVTCAALGVEGKFAGLQSLRIKETDRTSALKTELQKFNVEFYEDDDTWHLKGKTKSNKTTTIDTYDDHRMAMCFAPLCLKHDELIIKDAGVVNKSYPSFWNDLSDLGFSASMID